MCPEAHHRLLLSPSSTHRPRTLPLWSKGTQLSSKGLDHPPVVPSGVSHVEGDRGAGGKCVAGRHSRCKGPEAEDSEGAGSQGWSGAESGCGRWVAVPSTGGGQERSPAPGPPPLHSPRPRRSLESRARRSSRRAEPVTARGAGAAAPRPTVHAPSLSPRFLGGGRL